MPRSTSFILIGTGVVSVLLPLWLPSLHYITEVRVKLTWPVPREIFYDKRWSSQLFFAFKILVALHAVYHAEKLYRSGMHGPRFRWTLFTLIGTLCFWMLLDCLALMYRYLNVDALVIAFAPSLVADLLLAYHLFWLSQNEEKVGADFQPAPSQESTHFAPPLQISRTTLYKSYTLLVFGIFLLTLGFMGEIIRLIGTHLNFFLAFLTAFLLLLASLAVLLFRSIKERVQRFIARNFYKSLYDYRMEWERANQRTLLIQDAQTLYREVLHAVAEPVGTEGGCLLVPDTMNRLFVAASYGQVSNTFRHVKAPLIASLFTPSIRDCIWRYGKPIQLEPMTRHQAGFDTASSAQTQSGAWGLDSLGAASLSKDLAPLKEHGICIIVPVIFEQQLMGLILLARAAREYLQEDVDFLETIGGQISLVMANQKFREAIIESEEIKNFNRLSTFVLHDLKNATSMLSMLIQNADANLDNPEFRVDMFRTMSGVVERIQKLIRRLSTPLEQDALEFQPTDLQELIRHAVKTTGVDELPNIQFQAELEDGPPVSVAPLEIQRVLHNLLINAVESIRGKGEIQLKLNRCGTNVCITVKDTGCGMSQEYIDNDLFKPFRTSKEKGLGIGLYQCRTIVEAHQGRIEVESTQGGGSQFSVLLPLKK